MNKAMDKPVVVGIGNRFRGDDAAGLIALERLDRRMRSTARDGIRLARSDGELTDLLEIFRNHSAVYLLDAVRPSARTRKDLKAVFRWEALQGDLGSLAELAGRCTMPNSSHALGVWNAIRLGSALGVLPPRLVIYGIGGFDFAMKESLSPSVDLAIDETVSRVFNEICGAFQREEECGDRF